jgi:hypothetical protein
MSRVRRRERAARSREQSTLFSQYFQTASDEERVVAILILWVNAMVWTTLHAVLAVVVARAAHRSWRSRRSGLACALRAGSSATPVWVAGAMLIYQQAFRLWVLPALHRRLHIPPESSLPPSSR